MLNIGNLMVDSLDYILIVDYEFKIVYNTRYDETLNDNSNQYRAIDVIGKQYFDIYPKLEKSKSSVYQCLKTGEVIINKGQSYEDNRGRKFNTNNLTFPLMRKDKVIAAVELAIDVGKDSDDLGFDGPNKIFDDFVNKLRRDAGQISFDDILTANDSVKNSIEKAKILATLPNPTLIYGETGTGKELFAQGMITYSNVPKEKVITQNCAAVPGSLMEAILFGTVRGAYTGAENKKGLFEEADGGIIFLDELNSVPFEVQSKLLRVIQEGTFMPIGSNKEKHVKVKVIAAMNIDPLEAIEKNILRRDLFYRFSGGLISIPPLRKRKEDIGLFVNYYLKYFMDVYNKTGITMNQELKDFIFDYPWEGNVRELKNMIESMITLAPDETTLTILQIPDYMKEYAAKTNPMYDGFNSEVRDIEQKALYGDSESARTNPEREDVLQNFQNTFLSDENHIQYTEIMNDLERKIILEALKKANGNKSKAARILGLPRETLKYRIEKLGKINE